MKSRRIIRILCLGIIVISLYCCKPEEIILHGEISGLVTDTTNSQPLQAVPVKLNPVNDTTSTSSEGKYLFTSLIPGDYKIEVSKPPYATGIRSAVVTSARITEINFALHKIPNPRFSEKYLDFGFDSTLKSFTITNTGTGKLQYSITPSQEWITINPNIGEITTEPQTINVAINKAGLSEKKHEESIEVVSKIGLDYVPETIHVFVNGIKDQDFNYYDIVTIGTQTWMAENLNVGKFVNSSNGQNNNGIIEKYCYDNNKNNCDIYGGLYHWDEMMKYNPQDSGIIGTTQGICPVGWHIPTSNEWGALISYAGGPSYAGGNLKDTSALWMQPNTGATNQTGFSALPGGLGGSVIDQDPIWIWIGEASFFWSSTFYNDPEGNLFSCEILEYDSAGGVWGGYCRIDNGLQVRCIKDPPKK